MSPRLRRIILWTLGALAALLVVVALAVIIVVQTPWFRQYIRDKIITYAESATGGKVDLQSFSFDWTHMHANLTGFVLHGTEPPTAAPLFSAKSIDVNLKILSSFRHVVELEYLGVDQPAVDVIVSADGRTNVPSPKAEPTPSNTTVLEDIVNLAIRKFDIKNGTILFAERKSDFSAHGENLRAQLSYNILPATYDGRLSMAPLQLSQNGRPALNLNVTLPLHLERDKIQLTDGKIATSGSQILISGEMDHLKQPHQSAHLTANISLDEVKRAMGSALPVTIPPNGPGVLNADATVSMDQDHIQVTSARMTLGHSTVNASGNLKDPSGNNAMKFDGSLVLDELARLYKTAFSPSGTVVLSGDAKLMGASNDYFVNGVVDAKNLAFNDNGTRITGVNLHSDVNANKQAVELKGLRLAAFGGDFNGNAGIENMARFHLDGKLANFDLAELARLFMHEQLGYDGVISGPLQASGDLSAPSNLKANVHLAIAPGRHGVPVSGNLIANYNGATDSIDVAPSYVALPNTRLDLSGSLGRQLQLKLVSRNLNDFLPAMRMGSKNPPKEMPISLQRGGSATFTGEVTGKLATPQVAGHLALVNFEAQQRPFNSLVADLSASPSGASVQNGALTKGTLQAQFTAAVGLKNWAAPSSEPLSVNATVANADMADIMALAGEDPKSFSGTLNASARIAGTIGNPQGGATLTIANLTAYDEHFDQLAGQVNFSNGLISVPDMRLTAGQNRIDLTATYQHPQDSLSTGRLNAKVSSNTMQLAQFSAVKRGTPKLTGTLQINADAAATVSQAGKETEVMVSSVNANAAAHGLQFEGTNYGDFTATAQTSGNTVAYNVNSDFAGSAIHATGQTRLAKEYPTTANLNISNLHVEKLLAVAGRRDIPFTGVLSTNAQLSGTLNDPRANADLKLTNATYYEHFDSIQGHLDYSKQAVNITSFDIVSGNAHAQLTASFIPQPAGQFDAGRLTFKLNTNQVQLAQLKYLQEQRPGIGGVLQINADGSATLQNTPGQARIAFSKLDANVSATGLSINKKQYGDAKLTATSSGPDVVFNLDSNFAGSKIHGDGRAGLNGDYPANANLTFANVRYANLRDWFGSDSGQPANFDLLVDGSATVSGPLAKTADLKATLRIPKLEMTASATGGALARAANQGQNQIVLRNEGPIVASLDHSAIRVDSAHVTGPNTDISITGTATLDPKQDLNLNVNATTNLSLLHDVDRDVYASGAVVIQASVRGPLTDPSVNGRMTLQNASMNTIDAPNGLSNANGVIVFNGKTATIQSLTGESGGGKVAATGSVTYNAGNLNFNVGTTATRVRVRYPEGASTVADANVKLTGTTANSLLTGTVTVRRIAFNPRSDFGSMLTSSSTPVQVPAAPSPLLSNMHLQIQVQTAPDIQFQTSLAQNLELTANLRVRGTAETPGVLGRINITQGDLVFFGTQYTVNRGIISFYDPLRIEPVLNIDLETNVQGVDIDLIVTGPIDNMTLTHRSDPPLPFSEVIGLLAAGKAPSSDPVLAAHQPATPDQSLQQMGESALLGQAINPIAGQLQRVFGISQLKVAPAFVAGSELPQARLTLQQQVTRSVTFTYITDLANSNEQVVKAEWAINPTWSAVATRDENGIFSIDFFYKRRLK